MVFKTIESFKLIPWVMNIVGNQLISVYCTTFMAISTQEPNTLGGQPSSWSAEIDKFSFGLEDDIRRLFIISAGNSQPTNLELDYWDSVTLAEIEDPAQSWNG